MTLLEILALTASELKDRLPNLSEEELTDWLRTLYINRRYSGEYGTTLLLVRKEYAKRIYPGWANDIDGTIVLEEV